MKSINELLWSIESHEDCEVREVVEVIEAKLEDGILVEPDSLTRISIAECLKDAFAADRDNEVLEALEKFRI